MNKKALLGAAMAAVVILAGVLAAGMKKGDAEQSAGVQQEETKPLGVPVSAPATLPEGGSASEVYTGLTREIEALSKQAAASGSPEEQMRIFGQMEAKLKAFRSRYPDTPESLDAGFQLGAMNYSVQNYDQAAVFLGEFIGKADPADRQKLAYAHFYLAESFRGAGKYDDAEGEYKLILSNFSDVNTRLTSFVQSNMASLASERKLAVGGEPIPFSVKGIKGETLSPADYKGKVLLIDFWATWCGPCIAEMPNVKSVYKKYHGKGFEIVGISLDQDRDAMYAALKKHKAAWPQHFDGTGWKNQFARQFGVTGIPSTWLFDKKGMLRETELRGDALQPAVEKLLREE
ncbi:MAG TPA: redoxin family protein [Candidatus Krumholzibacteria bacterium]|nr:redoxin family protein [Candidatus Krumholzibacteria bacterium]